MTKKLFAGKNTFQSMCQPVPGTYRSWWCILLFISNVRCQICLWYFNDILLKSTNYAKFVWVLRSKLDPKTQNFLLKKLNGTSWLSCNLCMTLAYLFISNENVKVYILRSNFPVQLTVLTLWTFNSVLWFSRTIVLENPNTFPS
jgi:hypothetical protein